MKSITNDLTTRAGLVAGVLVTAFWIVVGIRVSAGILAILLLVAISMISTFVALLWGRWLRDQLMKRREQ